MKVLLINHFPLEGSGSGIYTKNIALSLVEKGHQVCIIMPANKKINNLDNIKLHPVYFKNKEKIDNQLAFNFPCFTTHPYSSKTFYDLTDTELKQYKQAFTTAIKEEVELFKPDIIHSNHLWILSNIATNFNIPLVVTVHGTDLIGYNKTNKFDEEILELLSKSKKIITVSKNNYELLNKKFDNINDKTVLIPNGFNNKVFYKHDFNKRKVLRKLNINEDYKNIVTYVGKLVEVKGVDVLLKAASIYQNNETLTLIVGEGVLLENLKELSEKLKLKNIVFIGNQSQDTLREIYNISDIVVVPSRSEAFGLVVIESLACGTPVIGSKVGGIPDIINNKLGILFDSENYVALSNDIQDIINNNISFDSNYIAKYVRDKYSQDKYINKVIKIYKRAKKK